MFEGDLRDVGLAGVLARLADSALTGCLRVTDPVGGQAAVFLRAGQLYAVAVPPGRLPDLGTQLVPVGTPAAEGLGEATEAQLRESLSDLLLWPEGTWRFRVDERTGTDVAPPVAVADLLAEIEATSHPAPPVPAAHPADEQHDAGQSDLESAIQKVEAAVHSAGRASSRRAADQREAIAQARAELSATANSAPSPIGETKGAVPLKLRVESELADLSEGDLVSVLDTAHLQGRATHDQSAWGTRNDDVAALLRELLSLGLDDELPAVPVPRPATATPAPQPPAPPLKRKKGLFGRG